MTDPDSAIGERVAAVETDIERILNRVTETRDELKADLGGRITETRDELKADLGRLDGRVTETRDELKADLGGRITDTRNELKRDLDRRITDTRDELRAGFARVEARIVETKEDYQHGVDILVNAMTFSKSAVYVICGTVIVGIVAALLKGAFL